MKDQRFELYGKKNSAIAALFLTTLHNKKYAVTLVHHNDADGLCAAAALARSFDALGIPYDALPIEKLHPTVLEKIFSRKGGTYIVYLDLGGQNADLIGEQAADKQPVLILDHHLPYGDTPENVLCLNPEDFGISGDNEISGASVAVLFAQELLKGSDKLTPMLAAELAVFGTLGAYGDRQVSNGSFQGINLLLFTTALRHALITKESGAVRFSAFTPGRAEKIVEILDSLGSIGFYSGSAHLGVRFLLGQDRQPAMDTATELITMRNEKFQDQVERIRRSGLSKSDHFQWIDVQSSFYPMGVKAIGLFLEHLIAAGIPDPDKYLLGFQHFPDFQPGIGHLDLACTKVSSRIPNGLKQAIQRGRYHDFMFLVPEAIKRIGGIADGCHRFAAAALIAEGREEQFIGALEQLTVGH